VITGFEDLPDFDDALRRLAHSLLTELAPYGWSVTAAGVDEVADDMRHRGISFDHPASGSFRYGVGRRPKPIAVVTREIREFVEREREFAVIERAPVPLRHSELLLVLRSTASAYQWGAPTVKEVAEALRAGRALEEEEAAWFAFAGPIIWGPIPDWAHYLL
jgi:hypothetical protein